MKKPITEELKKHYKSLKLDDQRMSALMSLQKQLTYPNKAWLKPAALGFAMAALMFFTISYFNQSPLEQKISNEVIYNHNKNMPPEVLTDDYGIISQVLDRLDFKVRKPQLLAAHFSLEGGRYCSIQGKIAAQLKYKSDLDNKHYTLYQSHLPASELKLEEPVELKSKGVVTKMWREGDLLFVLAQTI